MSPGEGNASVDVFWRSKEGFEMHLQLSGASSVAVLDEAQEAVEKITETGGEPRPARSRQTPEGGREQSPRQGGPAQLLGLRKDHALPRRRKPNR